MKTILLVEYLNTNYIYIYKYQKNRIRFASARLFTPTRGAPVNTHNLFFLCCWVYLFVSFESSGAVFNLRGGQRSDWMAPSATPPQPYAQPRSLNGKPKTKTIFKTNFLVKKTLTVKEGCNKRELAKFFCKNHRDATLTKKKRKN